MSIGTEHRTKLYEFTVSFSGNTNENPASMRYLHIPVTCHKLFEGLAVTQFVESLSSRRCQVRMMQGIETPASAISDLPSVKASSQIH
jgi:hypothetical protein